MTFGVFVFLFLGFAILAAIIFGLAFKINRLQEILQMEYTDILVLLTDIDMATNEVASTLEAQVALIADLQAQIAAGTPITHEQLDALGAALTAEKDRLTALATDPANPIPA